MAFYDIRARYVRPDSTSNHIILPWENDFINDVADFIIEFCQNFDCYSELSMAEQRGLFPKVDPSSLFHRLIVIIFPSFAAHVHAHCPDGSINVPSTPADIDCTDSYSESHYMRVAVCKFIVKCIQKYTLLNYFIANKMQLYELDEFYEHINRYSRVTVSTADIITRVLNCLYVRPPKWQTK
jgi:hypothetical protein